MPAIIAESGQRSMLQSMRAIRSRRSGQVVVLASLALVAFMGMVAMAIDVGFLWATRRTMQTASDAAAVAGAEALSGGTSVSLASAEAAGLNGFTTGNGSTITVNNPPKSGSYSGNASYVEVIIAQAQPTFFMKVMGYKTTTVSTRSVSGSLAGPAVVYALNSSSTSGAVTIPSGSSVKIPCSGIVSNSTSSSALSLGSGASLTASSVGVVGGYSGGSISPTPKTKIAPAADPLSSMACPTGNSCSRKSTQFSGTCSINSSETCSPCVYSGNNGYGYFGQSCGIGLSSPYNSHSGYSAMTVNFNAGTYGNYIDIGADNSHICVNATVNFACGSQFQCDSSEDYPSLCVGSYASGCTVNCNSGSGTYTFLGPVQCSGSNTLNLQPGTYYGGIQITGGSYSGPTVNFAPGTYVIGGGGLQCSGTCSISGTGCHFYNTSDTSGSGFSSAPFTIGANYYDNVSCSLSAPTSGSYEGCLFHQDKNIASSAHSCCIKTNSGSTCDGSIYCPGAALSFSGSSSSTGYTVVVADTVNLSGNSSLSSMAVGCNYASLSHGAPIKVHGICE
jgi:hypothetical protein